MDKQPRKDSSLYLKYQGRNYEFSLEDLNLDSTSNDEDFKSATALTIGFPVEKLANFVVDRPESGNIRLRPSSLLAD